MERFSDQDPHARTLTAVAERAQEQIDWIEAGAAAINSELPVHEVFPLPPEVRDEAPEPDWNEEQETTARKLGERLGYAAEQNVASGLRNSVALLEGGKVWKMDSEASALTDEDAKTVVVSGSSNRIIGDDEREFLVNKFTKNLNSDLSEDDRVHAVAVYQEKIATYTEYDYAVELALALTAETEEKVLPYGYDISEGNPLVKEETRQIVQRGRTVSGQAVVTMRIDRENYDEGGKSKYRNQPNPLRRMGILSDILSANDDTETPIVFMTSNAYASRQIDAIRAGLQNGRQYGVSMYGRATLAEVKSEDMQPGARLNHLQGDIGHMYDKLKRLLVDLKNS